MWLSRYVFGGYSSAFGEEEAFFVGAGDAAHFQPVSLAPHHSFPDPKFCSNLLPVPHFKQHSLYLCRFGCIGGLTAAPPFVLLVLRSLLGLRCHPAVDLLTS